ncbi:hypothetical protein D1953_08595 [Peribacillus asahii]|uniref:Uncharacterized protein n=1 Tax=Peribacillus asahii TaxID=228899 RepID=A0A398BFE0_9BACI|nr:hypothetical protein D1953_08595 [Peribacillus asahii]
MNGQLVELNGCKTSTRYQKKKVRTESFVRKRVVPWIGQIASFTPLVCYMQANWDGRGFFIFRNG